MPGAIFSSGMGSSHCLDSLLWHLPAAEVATSRHGPVRQRWRRWRASSPSQKGLGSLIPLCSLPLYLGEAFALHH